MHSMTKTMSAIAAAALLSAGVLHAQATATAAPVVAPEIGTAAPAFSAPTADSAGNRGTISLAAQRGKVVVVAFYPKDRTSGCTTELTKFRDEYGSLFGNGVVVVPVSFDSLDSHASWAHDMHFPFALASDPSGTMAKAYGSAMAQRPMANRTVFVIGKDGNVVYRDMHFGALDQHAYDELAAAIAKAKSA